MYTEGRVIKIITLEGSNSIVSNTMVQYLKTCAVAGDILPIPENDKYVLKITDGELEELKHGDQTMLRVIMTVVVTKV